MEEGDFEKNSMSKILNLKFFERDEPKFIVVHNFWENEHKLVGINCVQLICQV